jgi:type II restriction enzyme
VRNFDEWFSRFKNSISNYEYYVDFKKIYQNVKRLKIELNILNSLIGSKNIEAEFEQIINKYPETLKCIPLLLAVRESEIYVMDGDGEFYFSFNKLNHPINKYKEFMHKTGLFDLLTNHDISNIVDYVTGVETGLDSHGRKNRGGKLMENFVESRLLDAGFIKEVSYFKEMKSSEIRQKWKLDLGALTNGGRTQKKFDFVVKTQSTVYGIETNFYSSGGSKLNETARSYELIALESQNIDGFAFVWFTDGEGWKNAKNNLEKTFNVLEHLYNIADLKDGIIGRIFV